VKARFFSERARRLARISLVLGVFLLSGVHVERRSPPSTLRADPSASSYEAGFAGAIALRLDAAAWAELEGQPREFVWAEVEHDGVTRRARVRVKGHRSRRGLDDKPAFKLEFPDGDGIDGVRTLALNNMVEDPTSSREVLAYRWMSALGLAVPRTAYAELRLNEVDKGLYLMVEPLDDDFVAARAGARDLLYEGEYGCDIQASDVSGFDLDAGRDPKRARLKQFAERAAGDARLLFDAAAGPLEMRSFLDYLAASALIGDFDGYRHAHNYYAWYRPDTDKWTLLPWGLDRAFSKRLAIDESQGLLAKRCFRDPSCKLEYVRALDDLVNRFEALDLPAAASELAARVDSYRAPLDPSSESASKVMKSRAKLDAFLRERPAELRRQLGCIDSEGRELDEDNDGHGCTDCNDRNAAIHPGAAESCNAVDDDCSGLIDDAASCGCEVVTHDGAEFHLCALPMPWADAERICAGKGLSLARIDSKPLSKALYKKASRVDPQRWWIGYSDAESEGDFRWRDGSKGNFTYWHRRQPDNGSCNEDCAALRSKGNGKWQDTHCNQHRPFICGPVGH
jgi:hypothetical protein